MSGTLHKEHLIYGKLRRTKGAVHHLGNLGQKPKYMTPSSAALKGHRLNDRAIVSCAPSLALGCYKIRQYKMNNSNRPLKKPS